METEIAKADPMPAEGGMESIALGSRGLRNMGGVISEEYQKELRTLRQRVAVFQEMSNNPIVGAALLVYRFLLSSCEWRFEPKKDVAQNARAIEEAAFAAELLNDMQTAREDFMSEVLEMLIYGFSVMERTFKRRPDGRIGFDDIALRPADTIFEWRFDGERLVAVIQQLVMTQGGEPLRTIPADNVYLFRTSAVKNNPEGRSILRNAFEPYYRGKKHRDLQAIGHERDATGTPLVRVPDAVASATADQTALYERKQNANKIARRLKTGEEVGIVLSSKTDEESKIPLWDVSLLKAPGERQFDAEPIIARCDREVLFATITDMILLGHEKTGSINEGGSGASKDDLLRAGVNAINDRIADVVNRRMIPEAMTLNGVPEEFWPECKIQRLAREVSIDKFVGAIKDLTGAGMPLFPDDQVENEARARLRLPLKDTSAEV